MTGTPWQGLLLILLLSGSFQVLAQQPVATASMEKVSPGSVKILPVQQRDPNPSTSQRFKVEQIIVTGYQEYPELGITQAAVDGLVAKSLVAAQAASEPNSSGFSTDELDQLGRFLSGLNIHQRTTPLTAEESAAMLAFIETQKRHRGVSVVQLEQIAGQVSDFFEQHGLPLAVAFLPAQQVRQGEVRLEVLEGRLSQVNVVGAEHYRPQFIQQALSPLVGQIVRRRQIDSALYLLNDLPGLDSRGTFTAGSSVGDSRLDLAVLRDDRFEGLLQIDNHGDDETGNNRLQLQQYWFNPSGRGDRLLLGLLQSFSPTNATSGYAQYQVPVASLRNRFLVSASKGAFDWQEMLDGDTREVSLGFDRVLRRSRTRSLSTELSLTAQSLTLDQQTLQLEDQKLTFASGLLRGNWVFDGPRIEWDARVQFDLGRIREGKVFGQQSSFWRTTLDTAAWRLIALPGFAAPQKLSVTLKAQIGSGALPATLQFPLGGVHRVKAFDVSTYSGDRGIYTGLAYVFTPEHAAGSWRLFTGIAYGEQVSFGGADDSWAYLAGAGVGWDITLWDRFESRLRASLPLASKSAGYDVTDRGFNLYWSLRYRY